MNSLRDISLYLVFILYFFILVSCQNKSENEFVWFVVQPEVELGESFDFSIHFKVKPDSTYSETKEIKGLVLHDNLDEIGSLHSYGTTGDDEEHLNHIYVFYTYAKPTKIGRIDFPIMTIYHNGKEYKSKPFHINVVDKITIKENDIKVVWSSDKSTYKKTDTIKLSLYEYTKFSSRNRWYSPVRNLSLEEGEGELSLQVKETLESIAGIENFEEIIFEKFDLEQIDWNMSNLQQSMGKIKNETYIKALILKLYLLPTTTGEFTVGPSEYNYYIQKNILTHLSESFSDYKEGNNMPDDFLKIYKIKSNKLKILIK